MVCRGNLAIPEPLKVQDAVEGRGTEHLDRNSILKMDLLKDDLLCA